MSDLFAPLPTGLPLAAVFVPALLDLLPSGVVYYTPAYDAAGQVTDFRFAYLNPAAQRLLGLPAQPTVSYGQHFVTHELSGIAAFEWHRDTFLRGTPAQRDLPDLTADSDRYLHAHAVRVADGLLVSFTTDDPPQPLVAAALRESQAREQQAHATAERERQRFYDVLMLLPAQVATYHGPNHVFTFINARFRAVVGSTDLLGQAVRDGSQGMVSPEVVALLDQVYATGQPVHVKALEVVLNRSAPTAPERLLVDAFYFPLYDAQGQVNGVLDFSYDVTELVRARQQLQAAAQVLEARVLAGSQQALALQADNLAAAQRQALARTAFHNVFEQTPALIALLRQPGHTFEYANPAYQQLFAGRPLIGLDLGTALPEMQAQGYIALIDRVYQTGETFFGTELPFQLSPGADQPPQTHYYNFTYQAYREADEIVGVSIFAYDVTEQVLARQQREAQQQQLHRLLEQAPVAIAIFRGPEYVIELANPAVCTIWGRTPAQARHKPLFELLPEAAGQGFEELLDGVMATGVPYVAHELPSFINRHGRRDTVYWDFIYEPLPDSTGAISGVTVVATEVTAQVRARQQVEGLNEALASTNGQLQQLNEELRAANGQLTRTNVDLDNFIYTASHDLKAPISNIEGLLAALQTELPAEVAQAEYVGPILTRMLDSVNRFKQTISHLTDVSKLQKEFAPTVEAVRLAAVIDAVCLDLAPLLHETRAQLTVDVTDTPLLFLSAKNLRSVVYNLLSNALKYRHPDRRLHLDVRAYQSPGGTVLEVQDNGLGLDAVHLPKLFGMFQRFHDHVEGSGIGLYMVQRMVENVGGTIDVRSEVGVGSTFSVYLPHPSPGGGPAAS